MVSQTVLDCHLKCLKMCDWCLILFTKHIIIIKQSETNMWIDSIRLMHSQKYMLKQSRNMFELRYARQCQTMSQLWLSKRATFVFSHSVALIICMCIYLEQQQRMFIMLTHIGVNNVIYDHASNRCEYKDLHILSECNIYSTSLSVYRNIIFVSFLSEK